MIYVKDNESLKSQILKSGESLSSFAHRIGITRSAIYRILERGTVSPRNAKRIAIILGVPYDDIFLIDECPKDNE